TVPADATGGTLVITGSYEGHTGTTTVTVQATVQGITFDPTTVTLAQGETQQITVVANMSDGTTVDVTNLVTYSSADESLATVDTSGLIAISPDTNGGTVVITGSYEGINGTTTVTIPELVLSITADPSEITLKPGESQQLLVLANMFDSTQSDVTNMTSYSSSDETLAIVDATGLISIPDTANPGTVNIDMSYEGKTVRTTITIPEPPKVTSLTFEPETATLNYGETLQGRVVANISDGTQEDVTDKTTFVSSDSSIALVNENGLVTIPDASPGGEVYIRGYYGGHVATSVVNTSPGGNAVTSLSVTPSAVNLKHGETQQLQVLATMGDGSQNDVTSSAIYSSSDIRVTIDDSGLITVLDTASAGSTITINISYMEKTAKATVTIPEPPRLTSLTFEPETATLNYGETLQGRVMANFSDGAQEDVTDKTTFVSSDSSIALVDENGLITVPDTSPGGEVYIRGYYEGQVSFSILNISPGGNVVTSLSVNPSTVTLKHGETQQLQVLATMGDGSQNDVTSSAIYSSNDTNVSVDTSGMVTVSNTANEGSIITIDIRYEEKSTRMIVTIPEPPKVSSLAVNPSTVTLKPGDTQQLQVTATMDDGVQNDVTTNAFYSSSNAGVSVDTNGLITALDTASAGTVNIDISYKGKTARTTVTIPEPPKVTSLTFEPETATLNYGETLQGRVVANFSDGTQEDVTTKTTFASSDNSIALVDENGLVTIPDASPGGEVYIRGYYGGHVATSLVNTSPGGNAVTSLSVTPSTVTLKHGEIQQLQVIATMGDGSQNDVTSSAIYNSSDIRVTVDDSGLITVLDTASAGSTITINIRYMEKTARATVTIPEPPRVTSLTFEPETAILNYGETLQGRIMANSSDGTQEDVTDKSTFVSSDSSIALVDENGLITVPNTSPGGEVYIRGYYGGHVGYTIVTVIKPPNPNDVISLSVDPSTVTLKVGEAQQLQVMATMGDGSQNDVTSSAIYSSNDTNVSVDTNGMVTVSNTASAGTVNIDISYGGKTTRLTVTIPEPPRLTSIIFEPETATLNHGETLQGRVVAYYSDGTNEDITAIATYNSSDSSIASVDENGLITIPDTSPGGEVYIRGYHRGLVSYSIVTVPAPSNITNINVTSNQQKSIRLTSVNQQHEVTNTNQQDFTSRFVFRNMKPSFTDFNNILSILQPSFNRSLYMRHSFYDIE
ncbi:Ig-like domain-containing protein, partial [Cytobacillus sp. IB215316]|uniref:Ig-like domain-containing protein n=1 Tax=Cytobacillus sp. IB215316 TaxID=3097354 RepID=UPI002A11CE1B